MKKLISRKEAAEILQVHPQTISNYAKGGLLKEERKGGTLCYYYEAQVKALISPSAEIVNLEQEIQAYKDELRGIKQEYKSLKQEWHKKLHSAHSATRIYETVMAILMKFVDSSPGAYQSSRELVRREKMVVKGILGLKSTEEIGDEIGLTANRISQIFNKSLRKLMRYSSAITERDKLLETNKSLQQQIADLQYELEVVKAIKVSAGVSEEEISFKGSKKEALCAKYPILREKMSDMMLSVRCYNCLKWKIRRCLTP